MSFLISKSSSQSSSQAQLKPESLPYTTSMKPSTVVQGPPPQISPNNTQGTYQQPQVVYVTQQAPTGGMSAVGPNSTKMTCPSCRASIASRVDHVATSKTHLWACCLCFCCCWCCACLPYCMSSCQNADHYCPNCHAYLGTYCS